MPFDYERFRERLFPALLAGDRRQARLVAANAREQGAAEELVTHGYSLKELAALYRSDLDARPPLRHLHLAQPPRGAQLEFSVQEPTSDGILIFFGICFLEELQGLIAADILKLLAGTCGSAVAGLWPTKCSKSAVVNAPTCC